MENNNHRFYVGQKVLCIKSSVVGVSIKGRIYEVFGISKCKKCDSLRLDLGFDVKGYATLSCGVCYNPTRFEGIAWQNGKRFVPIDDEVELSDTTVEELLEEFIER